MNYEDEILGAEHLAFIAAEKCTHPPSAIISKVIGGYINCETTVDVCTICGETVTEPKTDC